MVRVDGTDNTKAGKFHETLIGICQTIADNGPDTIDHREMFCRDVATTIGGCLEGCSLNCDGEEVEVIEQSGKATLSYNGTREFLRYFLQCLDIQI